MRRLFWPTGPESPQRSEAVLLALTPRAAGETLDPPSRPTATTRVPEPERTSMSHRSLAAGVDPRRRCLRHTVRRAAGLGIAPLLLLVVAGCGAIAVGGGSTGGSSPPTFHGTVRQSPTCPAEPVGTPCPSRPMVGAVVDALRGDVVVGSTTTGADGTFAFVLSDGAYTLRVAGPHGYPPPTTRPFTVPGADLEILLDSGIR